MAGIVLNGRQRMRARVSKISLTVFGVLLVLSFGVASVAAAEKLWLWYAVKAVVAVVPIVVGPRRSRLIGAIGLAFAIVMIVGDIPAVKLLGERMHRNSVETTQPNPQTMELTGAPIPSGAEPACRSFNPIAGVGVGCTPELIEVAQVDLGYKSGSARLRGRQASFAP